MSQGSQENEIKLAVADAAAVRGLLRRVGFRLARRRVFEANTVFDTPGLTLRRGSRLLRTQYRSNCGPAAIRRMTSPVRRATARHRSIRRR